MDEPSAITIEDVRSLDMGYGLPHYDAILLYDDADIDWADQIYSKLTSYGFSVSLWSVYLFLFNLEIFI